MIDPDGRYIFLKGKLGSRVITLVNVYCPNRKPTFFLGQVLKKLSEFGEGEVVLGGDLNFCVDPELDGTSRAQGIGKVLLGAIRRKLHRCQLMDVWRLQHPKERDYTFLSPVHGTYSRLDYFYVDHSLLEWVKETNIEITSLSNHSPITMRVIIPEVQGRLFSWKLNEDLLRDPAVVERLHDEVDFFFKTNDTGDVSPAILWETHKAYVRGILVSIGAGLKKKKREERGKLIEEIFSLEQAHKKTKGQDQDGYHLLVAKREELRDTMEQEAKRAINAVTRNNYYRANKSSKHLARLIRKKRSRNYVVLSKGGEERVTSDAIAEEFKTFYGDLYSTGQQGSGDTAQSDRGKEFLKGAGLAGLSAEDRDLLDKPIEEEEILAALRDFPKGKSPGPDGFTSIYLEKMKHSGPQVMPVLE